MNHGTENQPEIGDSQLLTAHHLLREMEGRLSEDVSRVDKMCEIDPDLVPRHLIEHLGETANAIQDALLLVRQARLMMYELL